MDSDPATERARAAPYVDVAPAPWWLALAGGAWAGALVAMLALTEHSSPVSVVGIGLLLLVQMAFVGWYPRRHGALPSRHGAPAEFRPTFDRYRLGILAVMVATAAVWLLLNAWVAAATAAVLVGVGLAAYVRSYAAAAARTRQRLA